MSAPTKAQIEAARKLLRNSSCFSDDVCSLLPCKCVEAALTAAAEAGEKAYTDLTRQQLVDEIIRLHDEADATIERCAQVVESYGNNDANCAIARAIRALKDSK